MVGLTKWVRRENDLTPHQSNPLKYLSLHHLITPSANAFAHLIAREQHTELNIYRI